MFKYFSDSVLNQYNKMAQGELFTVDVLDIYDSYQKAFPAGTNEIYRERPVHDCNTCKQFIRRLGIVVSIENGQIVSVWDNYENLPHPYNIVGRKMRELVEQAPISGIFRSKEGQYGMSHNYDDAGERYEHFCGKISQKHKTQTPDKAIGDARTTAEVFERGLKELRISDFELVLDLIDRNEIYRGAEFKAPVKEFQQLIKQYNEATIKGVFVWSNYNKPFARFRNTAIGSLLVELAEGKDLENAVKSFEAKVAPTNYKRPTAIVSTKMIDDALTKIEELGLTEALERRHAKIEDISINNVLFVDNSVRGEMKDSLASTLKASAKVREIDVKNAAPISADDFFSTVVPKADKIQVFVENKHESHLVTLTTAVHPNSGNLFKWLNDFAWSYNGEVTDSIKERVKAAGGKVDVPLRVSLSWFNYDDLDFHTTCPDGTIYYGNKQNILDVDMNAGSGKTREAVENLSWTKPKNGHYSISVNQFFKRENIDVGFTVQFAGFGKNEEFTYDKQVVGMVPVLSFSIENGQLTSWYLSSHMKGGSVTKDIWGIKTQTLVDVDTLMFSPNYWDQRTVGNKHWFFILKDCKNPDSVRGIYNEFLTSDLQEHKRVFELLGSKTKCAFSEEQLSGLGFSSTKHDSVKVVVKSGASTRAYEIQF